MRADDRKRMFWAGLLFAAGLASTARAVGLSTNFGNVWVANVPMGSTVSLRDLTGVVYRVTNTGLNAEDVEVSPIRPDASREPVWQGYEAIPDPGWIRLAQDKFYLAPGQEGVSDVFMNIPKDERYLGKKFQVWLWARNVAKDRFLAVGLKSRILIQVASTLQTQEEKKKSEEVIANLDFHLNPPLISLSAPRGEKIAVQERLGKAFKLINLTDKAMRIKVSSLRPGISGQSAPTGVKEGAAHWLAPDKERLTVEPNSVLVIPFSLHIPKDAGKGKFFLVLKADLEGYPVPISAYGQVIVDTSGED
ncbi:MAG: hypothetical protein HY403_04175 [Elusimicrobia bacterium]|nr:hypothetical protein [Elusimicrobiota bacterium]